MAGVETFIKLLEKGPDSALLRYSLANAYAAEAKPDDAISHLLQALEMDREYSAAWKLLGRCYFDTGDYQAAVETYRQGIEVADEKGDKQAAKEMKVFLKRCIKALESSDS